MLRENQHPEERLDRKRMAIHVVSLLPRDPQEALAVLSYARGLVENFLIEEEAEPRLKLVRRAVSDS